MSPRIAAHAASFIGSGIGKSGKPCARLIAPYWFETRVISRITDSVKVLALLAVAARLDVCCLSIITLSPGLQQEIDLTNHTAFRSCARTPQTARVSSHQAIGVAGRAQKGRVVFFSRLNKENRCHSS